jgi:hypothetical protein
MLRIIALIVFLSIIGILIYRNRGSLPELKTSIRKLDWWLSIIGIKPAQVTDDWRKLTSFLIKVSFLVLAITGFIPLVLLGTTVSGFVLILHVIAAAIFALGLVIVSLLRAHDHRFNKNDWQSLQHVIGEKPPTTKSNPHFVAFAKKISFWLILLLSLPLIASILLGMYPLFGTHGQEALLQVHGYSALLLVLAVIVRLYILKLEDK